MKIHDLGKRTVKRRDMVLAKDPISGANGLKMAWVETEEQQPILTAEEAKHVPAEEWKPCDSPHGKFVAVYQDRRFFTDEPPKDEKPVKKTAKKDD